MTMTPSTLDALEAALLSSPQAFREALVCANLAYQASCRTPSTAARLFEDDVHCPQAFGEHFATVDLTAPEVTSEELAARLMRMLALTGAEVPAHQASLPAVDELLPSEQVLACLRVLCTKGGRLAERTHASHSAARQAATDRLHDLVLRFPVLMHPQFVYAWDEAAVPLPLLQSMEAVDVSLPTLSPRYSRGALRAWTLHPAVSEALHQPAPALRQVKGVDGRAGIGKGKGKEQGGSGKSFIETVHWTGMRSRNFSTSLLALDRLRCEPCDVGNVVAPKPLLSVSAERASTKVKDIVKAEVRRLTNSWLLQALRNWDDDEDRRQADEEPPERTVREPGSPTLVFELANAPGFSVRTFADEVLRSPCDLNSQLWTEANGRVSQIELVLERLRQLLFELTYVRFSASTPEAAVTVAAHLLQVSPESANEYLADMRRVDVKDAATFILEFERHGVSLEQFAELMEAGNTHGAWSDTPAYGPACTMLRTSRMMRETIAAITPDPVAAVARPARRPV